MFINFGTILPLNDSEQVTFNSYDEVKAILQIYIDKAYKLDQYGLVDKATPIWEYGNKVIYLVNYLFIIRDRINKDYVNCNLQTFKYYNDLYKLDCIRETFSCLTIPFDVDLLYSAFGLDKNFGFDGINYMAVEEDSSPACDNPLLFIVR